MEERTWKSPGDLEVTAPPPALRWAGATEADCPARPIFDRIGDRWSMFVLVHLEAGPLRFNAIRRRIANLSQRILTVTVRSLERDGLILRTVYPTVPPQVDYRITPLGRSLLDAAEGLVAWSADHQGAIRDHRALFDGRPTPAPDPGPVL